MNRNRFLIDKPQSVQKAEKVVAKKKAAEEKRQQEAIAATTDLLKKKAVTNAIQKRGKANTTQKITLSSRAQPRQSTYGGCGSIGGC